MNSKRLYRMSLVVLLLLGWELIARFGSVPAVLFPSVGKVLIRWFEMLRYEALITKTIYSVSLVLGAITISLIMVFLILLISEKSGYIKENASFFNAVLSPIPGVAILPLVIIWFGLSTLSMMIILVHASMWPLWSQLSTTLEKLNLQFERFVRSYRIHWTRQVYHIYILGMRKDIFSSLGVAWSRGWRALISIEMIFGMSGQYSGLGWLIFERRMYMDTAGLYAGVLMIALCGVVFETLLFKYSQ